MDDSTPPQEATIRRYLHHGEQLIWSGRPAKNIHIRPLDFFAIVPGILILLMMAYLTYNVLSTPPSPHASSPPVHLILIALIFFGGFWVAGIYLSFGFFWYEAKKRAHTFYGLTNQRLLILSGIWTRSCQSLDLASMTDLSLHEYSDGSGDITFGPSNPRQAGYENYGWLAPGLSAPILSVVQDAATLFRLIQKHRTEQTT